MAKGVQTQKKKVLGARRATAVLGKQASKVQLRGRVTEKVGASRDAWISERGGGGGGEGGGGRGGRGDYGLNVRGVVY